MPELYLFFYIPCGTGVFDRRPVRVTNAKTTGSPARSGERQDEVEGHTKDVASEWVSYQIAERR